MKGGNFNIFLWRRFFLALAIIVFITIFFLWSSEQNPLASLVSSEEFLVQESSDSSKPLKAEKRRIDGFVVEQEGKKDKKNLEEFLVHHSSDSSKPLKAEKQNIDGFVVEKEGKKAKRNMDGLRGSANSSATTNKDCNYAKGTWVADSLRPLYSGSGCKQWLSSMWACRLTRRADFSYEGYRWQPEACDMPEFIAPKFLERMQDKTIAFIGDSLGREQFQSLMCMVTGGEEKPEVENFGWKYGLVKPPGAVRPEGWAYRFPHTNTTILYYWSASLCNIEPINITDRATEYAMHLDRPPAFLSRFLHYFDVVVLNTGHHWNRGKFQANKWVMHMNGKPIEDKKHSEIGTAKNYTVNSNVKWLDLQIAKRPGLQGFFRTMSPRHFFNGDWNTGGHCNNTTPLSRGNRVTQDESSDPVIARAVKGTKVRLLDITAVSDLRDEAHISHYSKAAEQGASDCLHWCLPGIPDTWNEILCAQI